MATSTRFYPGQNDYIEQLNELDDAITSAGVGNVFLSNVFTIKDYNDQTKVGKFDLSGIASGTTATWKLPNVSSTLAVVDNVSQTFAGATTFSSSVTFSGALYSSTQVSVAAAGTNQSTATALTKDFNVISTVATGAGVVLPTAAAGRTIVIANTSANALNVYPATGGKVESLATNAAYSVAAGERKVFKAASTTQWFVMTTGSGGATSVVNNLTTSDPSSALSAQMGVTLNKIATQTPGSYAAPSKGSNLAAETTVTHVTCDWINLIASDGKTAITTSGGNSVGSGVGWQGNGIETVITMADGTQFLRYASSAGDKLIRSPTGGGKNGSTWTVIMTTTGTMDYSLLLRDPTTDTVLYFVPTGSSRNWTMQCYAFDSAGNQLCHSSIPQYLGFLDGISTNSYYRAGIGPTDGRFAIMQPLQYWPAQSQQRTQTLGLATLILTGQYNRTSNTFSFDEPYRLYDDERWAYHTPVVGLNGDPDFIAFLCGRDVLNSEDTDPVTKLPGGDSGFYDFDQIGYGWYNRRTRQSSNGIKRVTPRLGFMNSPCYAYVSWNTGDTSLTLNSIISGSIRWGQKVTVADNSGASIGTAYLGTSSGAVGASIPLVTQMGGSVAITALTGSGSNVLVKLIEPTGTVATPQKRFVSMTVSNDGFIYAAYINSRHAGSASKALTGGNAANSYRLLKVSAMGEVVYDEELFSEGSTNGQNYHTTFQCNLTGAIYLVRSVPNSSVGLTEVHFLKIFEKQSFSAANCSTTSGSGNVTINAGTISGIPYVGMKIAGAGIPLDSYVSKWNSYNPTTGTGIITLNNLATATASGVAVNGWARVCMEDRLAINSINSVYGTNGAYKPNNSDTAIPQTLPARSCGFIPFIADNRSGSVETTNTVEMFMFRKENDWPTNSSPNGYLERLEQVHVRLPG